MCCYAETKKRKSNTISIVIGLAIIVSIFFIGLSSTDVLQIQSASTKIDLSTLTICHVNQGDRGTIEFLNKEDYSRVELTPTPDGLYDLSLYKTRFWNGNEILAKKYVGVVPFENQDEVDLNLGFGNTNPFK